MYARERSERERSEREIRERDQRERQGEEEDRENHSDRAEDLDNQNQAKSWLRLNGSRESEGERVESARVREQGSERKRFYAYSTHF